MNLICNHLGYGYAYCDYSLRISYLNAIGTSSIIAWVISAAVANGNQVTIATLVVSDSFDVNDKRWLAWTSHAWLQRVVVLHPTIIGIISDDCSAPTQLGSGKTDNHNPDRRKYQIGNAHFSLCCLTLCTQISSQNFNAINPANTHRLSECMPTT